MQILKFPTKIWDDSDTNWMDKSPMTAEEFKEPLLKLICES